jgi:hypothetical protein
MCKFKFYELYNDPKCKFNCDEGFNTFHRHLVGNHDLFIFMFVSSRMRVSTHYMGS